MSRISRSLNPRFELPMFKMYSRIGCHLNEKEIKLLVKLLGRSLKPSLQRKIKSGKDLFLALSKQGFIDESNFYGIIDAIKQLNRHDVLHMVPVRQKTKVSLDPVEEYLKNISQVPQTVDSVDTSYCNQTLRIKFSEAESSSRIPSDVSESGQPPSKRLRRSQRICTRSFAKNEPAVEYTNLPGLRKKYTCDVRLRVRAEYCNYESVLQGNVSSMKADPVERQLECFSQASAILRTRDLGYIVCDIKFSEITYLDAFWRDYLNGSLLEALKGVFITESLKQAVGNEAIKLLVNVEESDYEKGRSILMNNLHQSL